MSEFLCEKFSVYYKLHEGGYAFYNPYKDELEDGPTDTSVKMISDITTGSLYKQKKAYSTPATEVVKTSTRGYKVFATKDFRVSDIVEIAPVIIQPSTALALDTLKDILYQIDDNTYALVLGNGSLYDASRNNDANIEFAWNAKTECMYFIAKRNIQRGEELTINYGDDYWSSRVPELFKMELANLNSDYDMLNADTSNIGNVVSKILFNKSVEGS
ncbi:MAG: SET domain-containing protein-lysine N-methyltransferase [Bacteroidales bacterium]